MHTHTPSIIERVEAAAPWSHVSQVGQNYDPSKHSSRTEDQGGQEQPPELLASEGGLEVAEKGHRIQQEEDTCATCEGVRAC